MSEPASEAPAPSERVRLRRLAERGRYDDETVRSILAEGVVAHVAVSTEQGPLALPMAYGCSTDTMYLHGAVGNAVLGAATDRQLCATVTLLDGLVLARTAFHNSMNFRSVVVRGEGRRVTDPGEHELALQLISDHVVPTWSSGRPASASEIRRTLVLALPLAEASAKVRAGDPVDEPEDLDGPFWAGTVAVRTTFGPPVPAADLAPGIGIPQPVADRFS